jgi:hypothetical protein
MRFVLPLRATLPWPDSPRPSADDLAAALAGQLSALGFARVVQDGATVRYSKAPWLGSRWDPLGYASSGEILISPSTEGFLFHCRLNLGKMIVLLALAAALATFFGYQWARNGVFSWFPVAWLLGVGGLTSCWLFLGAPRKLVRLVTPPSNEVEWRP